MQMFPFPDMMSPLQSTRACSSGAQDGGDFERETNESRVDTIPFFSPIIHLFIIERGLAWSVMNRLLPPR